MNRVFLVNAPSIFSFGWSIVKGFLDAGTLDKIHILNSKEFSNGYLLDFIDADSLPKRYGGKCECTHMVGGCVPSYKDFEDLRKSNFEPGQGQSFGNAV